MATQFDFTKDKVTNDNIRKVADIPKDYGTPPVSKFEKFLIGSFASVIIFVILSLLEVI